MSRTWLGIHEETKRACSKVVDRIRIGGPQTVKEIAFALGETCCAVRYRLDKLRRDGIVDRRAEPGPLDGKPSYIYHLTGKELVCERPKTAG